MKTTILWAEGCGGGGSGLLRPILESEDDGFYNAMRRVVEDLEDNGWKVIEDLENDSWKTILGEITIECQHEQRRSGSHVIWFSVRFRSFNLHYRLPSHPGNTPWLWYVSYISDGFKSSISMANFIMEVTDALPISIQKHLEFRVESQDQVTVEIGEILGWSYRSHQGRIRPARLFHTTESAEAIEWINEELSRSGA